jgi:hypothetical protein
VVGNGPTGTVWIRSVINQSSPPVGPVVTFALGMSNGTSCTQPSDCHTGFANCVQGQCIVTSGGFNPVGAVVVPGTSIMLEGRLPGAYGTQAPGLGALTFPIGATMEEAVQPTASPAFTPWPTPADCQQGNGFPGNIAVTPPDGSGLVRYVTACRVNTPVNGATLWVGGSDATMPPVQVATGTRSDTLMNPQVYAYLANEHFIGFTANSGIASGAYAFGSDPTQLAASLANLTLSSNQAGIPMALVPDPANDGFAFFAASVDPTLLGGSLWSGTVHPADYSSLKQTPPPMLAQFYSATTITTVSGVDNPTVDAKSIYSAGASFDGTTVNLNWFRRDGTPLVVQQQLYSSTNATCTTTHTCNTVMAAAVAPLGSFVVAVWSEQTTGSNPTYSVSGLKMLCSGD